MNFSADLTAVWNIIKADEKKIAAGVLVSFIQQMQANQTPAGQVAAVAQAFATFMKDQTTVEGDVLNAAISMLQTAAKG